MSNEVMSYELCNKIQILSRNCLFLQKLENNLMFKNIR